MRKAPTFDAQKLLNSVTTQAIEGIYKLSPAKDLADEYLYDQKYRDDNHRINALINWESGKNFTSGFVTSLGGAVVLPISVPTAIGASWIIQARMSAAIAAISGYELNSDRVRTFILATLVGDALKDIVRSTGVEIGQKLSASLIRTIPGPALISINKAVGFRLVTKAGEKGVINLSKGVPLVGGVVGGGIDVVACKSVGRAAKKLFFEGDDRIESSDSQIGVNLD